MKQEATEVPHTRHRLNPRPSGRGARQSTMAVLADGSVGDLYEIGATGGIVFSRFTLPWLES